MTITIEADQYGRVSPTQVVDLFSRMVNASGGRESVEFAEAFSKQHRTLQQKMVAVMLTCLARLADDATAGYIDPRNQAAADIARRIANDVLPDMGVFVSNDGEVRLPLI